VLAASLVVASLAFAKPGVFAAESPAPSDGLARLQAGNARFVKNQSESVALGDERRTTLAKGQAPFAIVLSCADSRVPPEYVFNVGLGELFVIRAAGEVVDRSVLASVEYAAEHLNVPLLVVMGHESCGAVKAAGEPHAGSLGPNLDFMVNAIRPAVERTPKERDWLKSAILANVEQSINDAMAKSTILTHLVDAGKLQVVGAYYQLASGRVMFSQPLTSQTAAAHGDHK
jgi:carbonic anhydrase